MQKVGKIAYQEVCEKLLSSRINFKKSDKNKIVHLVFCHGFILTSRIKYRHR